MPNWAEGSLKLRGKKENIAQALKYMFCTDAKRSKVTMLYIEVMILSLAEQSSRLPKKWA